VVAVLAVVAAAVGDRLATSSSTSPPPGEHRAPPGDRLGVSGEPALTDVTTAGALADADGAVRNATTAFADGVPGIAKLDPGLLEALRRAATGAAAEGVELLVDSGWRSPKYQRLLLDEAIMTYGSEEKAARWVAPPDRSAHVSGNAVDIGPSKAAAWLSRHGAAYGLCQVYGNEPWHYELRPDAPDQGCPATYADPTQDPRLKQ
jgi:hypothetical protein